MPQPNESSSCLRTGCIGCAGLAAAAVIVVGLLAVVGLALGTRAPDPVEETADRPLPELPELSRRSAAALAERLEAAGESAPAFLGDLESVELGDPPVGVLDLDLSVGDFTLEPGAAGSPIEVSASFDASRYRLEEELEEHDDGTFAYHVRFGPRGGILGMIGVNRGNPRVEITIPRGRPFDVVGTLGLGRSRVDLGGLWLRDVDLRLGTGEHELEISEPLLLPMRSLRLRKGIGRLEVRDVGAGSPAEVDIEQSIGEAWIDLDGPWRRDATVSLELGIGGSRVRLPDGVRVELDREQISIGERRIDVPDPATLPEGTPTITLSVSGNIGQIEIDS
jgi:hypothetical protein